MYLITVYVPESHLNEVKEAVFDAGAGQIGNYSNCCWQTLGEGQFKPTQGSNAFIGTLLKLETLPEYKLEFVCKDKLIQDVITALKNAHPYETPAYQVIKLVDF